MVAIVTLIYVGKKKNKKISLYKSFNITWLHCDNPSARAAAVHLQLQNLLCLIHQLGQAYAHMHKHCTDIRKHVCTIVQTYVRTHRLAKRAYMHVQMYSCADIPTYTLHIYHKSYTQNKHTFQQQQTHTTTHKDRQSYTHTLCEGTICYNLRGR